MYNLTASEQLLHITSSIYKKVDFSTEQQNTVFENVESLIANLPVEMQAYWCCEFVRNIVKGPYTNAEKYLIKCEKTWHSYTLNYKEV